MGLVCVCLHKIEKKSLNFFFKKRTTHTHTPTPNSEVLSSVEYRAGGCAWVAVGSAVQGMNGSAEGPSPQKDKAWHTV